MCVEKRRKEKGGLTSQKGGSGSPPLIYCHEDELEEKEEEIER